MITDRGARIGEIETAWNCTTDAAGMNAIGVGLVDRNAVTNESGDQRSGYVLLRCL